LKINHSGLYSIDGDSAGINSECMEVAKSYVNRQASENCNDMTFPFSCMVTGRLLMICKKIPYELN